MPQTLASLPAGTPIAGQDGIPTDFFRLLWSRLRDSMVRTPTEANTQVADGLTAALATTTLFTTTIAGVYRVTVYLEKTVAGGVTSSLTPTIGWTRGGAARTWGGAALTTDTVGANQSYTHTFYADAVTAITLAVAYASNAAATMVWSGWAETGRFA